MIDMVSVGIKIIVDKKERAFFLVKMPLKTGSHIANAATDFRAVE